jgi:glutathione S-transferase
MLLRFSPTSPFVRKVMVLVHETDLVERVRTETVDGWAEPDQLTAENPLSMVPTLVLSNGRTLYDSRVICEYLDAQHDGGRLIPAQGEERWGVLRDQALADGILDAAVLIFVERHKRPEPLRWDWWLQLKGHAIERSLDVLERDADALTGRVDLGAISLAVALSYLDLRGAVGEWREGRTRLADWHSDFSARPSMLATQSPT